MTNARGFSLMELLVVLVTLGIVMAGAVGVMRTHSVSYTQQELSVALDDNLRLAMTAIRDELRRARYGVPTQSLSSWVDWVSGTTVTSNPLVVQGSGTNPDRIHVAACTSRAVAYLDADAAIGTSVSVDTPGEFNDTNKRLIRIGDSEFARVTAVSGNTLTIDTDPVTANNQALSREYLTGTPVCRVDAVTFDLVSGELRRDLNQGAGPEAVATGIIDFQIDTAASWEVTLTGRTEHPNPGSGGFATRGLVSSVTMRN